MVCWWSFTFVSSSSSCVMSADVHWRLSSWFDFDLLQFWNLNSCSMDTQDVPLERKRNQSSERLPPSRFLRTDDPIQDHETDRKIFNRTSSYFNKAPMPRLASSLLFPSQFGVFESNLIMTTFFPSLSSACLSSSSPIVIITLWTHSEFLVRDL